MVKVVLGSSSSYRKSYLQLVTRAQMRIVLILRNVLVTVTIHKDSLKKYIKKKLSEIVSQQQIISF